MMRMGKHPKDYDLYTEARFHLLMYSPGAQKLGFTDATDLYQYQQFMKKLKLPSCKPQGRVIAGRNEDFIGVLNITDNSINRFYESLTPKAQDKFWQEVWKPALEVQQKEIDKLIKARTGAGGKTLVDGETVALHGGHALDRSGKTRIHSHSVFSRYTVTADGKEYSITEREFHVHRERLDRIFQVALAMRIEIVFGVKMGIDPQTKTAFVPGYERSEKAVRNEAAEELLRKHGQKKTKRNMDAARMYTRPKKKPYEHKKTERPKQQGNPEPVIGKSWWGEVLKDYLLEPLKVYKAAWRYSKQKEVVKVDDIDQFMIDVKKTSLKKCRRAAIKAIRKTRCTSFLHALQVAEVAHKAARKPKLAPAKGTRINVVASAIKSDAQLEALQVFARAKGWHVHVVGRRQEQGQEQGRTL
jgi:hypothetical protein